MTWPIPKCTADQHRSMEILWKFGIQDELRTRLLVSSGILESQFPWDFPSFSSAEPQVNEQRRVARAARARPESASRRKPTANDQRRVGMRAWRTACCVASDTEKGRTEVVWHILWLVVLIDDPKWDQHVFSGSNYQPVMIAWDWLWFLLLSLWACSCCTPLWVTHANHMLTMCFLLSAFFL